MSDRAPEDEEDRPLKPESVRAVRAGHGANCSSIGSVVDTLFASAVVGGAVFAVVMAAMKREAITVVQSSQTRSPAPPESRRDEDDGARG